LDAEGQVLSQREIITATSRVFHFQKFSYDAAGQVSNKFTAPAGHPWTDPAFTGTCDDDNRLLTANGGAVVHDADGNMTSGPITATSGTQMLVYNARNQLTSAVGITYSYDAEGRRRTMVQGANTTRYTIDPNGPLSRLLVKHNPDGTKTYYVFGLGLLYDASKIGASAETTITHHYDQVGSTVIRTDGTGNDVGRAEYSPYGQITWQTGNMVTPFLYNGKFGVMTDANGLLHMRARFYSPYLMRFLNPDPIGFSGGQNWFAFADGNPISANDPMGLTTAEADWSDDTKSWLTTNSRVIQDAAYRNGVSPRDLANALAEENQRQGVSDTIQNAITEYSIMLGNGITSAAHYWKTGHHRNADIGPANINFDAAEAVLLPTESPDIQKLANRLLTAEGTAEFGARIMSAENAVIAPYIQYVTDPNEVTALRTNAWREGASRLGARIEEAAGGDVWMYSPSSGNDSGHLSTRLDFIDKLFLGSKPSGNYMWK
jgi:RHS repeat-associated protein